MAAYMARGSKYTDACFAGLCFSEKWILHQLRGVKIQVNK